VVIPARAGSKGIPKKNVRFLNGQPLITYVLSTCQRSSYKELDVVVSTDDPEMARIASMLNCPVVDRPLTLSLDNTPLDPVIYHATKFIEDLKKIRYEIVITVQPTSPLLQTATLDAGIQTFISSKFDSLISVINNPHLSWSEKEGQITPNYDERLNRQYLPKHFIETGSFMITKREFVTETSRLGNHIGIYEIPLDQAIDIDTPKDWWVAEKLLNRKNIIIRVEGYPEIGLGHVYRGLELANNLIDHKLIFVISSQSSLGINKIESSNFPYEVIDSDNEIINVIHNFNCDIIINDILNTNVEYIKMLKATNVKVINFEDLGQGAEYADVIINDLYEKQNNLPNHYWGAKYYLLREEFHIAKRYVFREIVEEILVIFGGTDPSNLTFKLLQVAKLIKNKNVHFTFIVGMGYQQVEDLVAFVNEHKLNFDIIKDVKNITEYMCKADIAISSQGRTMLELVHMNVPTILLAQSDRELTHEFGHIRNGFINMGVGKELDEKTLKQTIIWLVNSPQIRKQMHDQMMKNDFKSGIKRVLKLILEEEIN
jgi:CMP-N-acetylneuraminic acid synthetase/spore coat polysaccharide biosynthesis predicted glycosyltransferase SpsG